MAVTTNEDVGREPERTEEPTCEQLAGDKPDCSARQGCESQTNKKPIENGQLSK